MALSGISTHVVPGTGIGAASDARAPQDFMASGYDLIGEPLNLLAGGQAWFSAIFARHVSADGGRSLVLGATPWMVRLLQSVSRHVIVVDMSAVMLASIGRDAAPASAGVTGVVECRQGNWLDLPASGDDVSVILSDNSFSFLRFPDQWDALAGALAARLRRGGRVLVRFLSVPPSHTAQPIDRIAGLFEGPVPINYTEVRARLLFSHWDELTAAIVTEDVLHDFEAHRAMFEPMLQRASEKNDLLTIEKYRGANAVYYAPRLDAALSVLSRYLDIVDVQFGPYPLAEYFPLIVAVKA